LRNGDYASLSKKRGFSMVNATGAFVLTTGVVLAGLLTLRKK